ncbi:hypothetical protein Tsubulata_022804 [Turnera subulata]|uniref:MSP domain-containing protein n=1 Tax=Turnera subulata TaxID=218843 RepID=A0A9Q0F0R3_9ROSI|nr:hypothetical protein Tsubulata_022804 [Turnera subulata]
MSSTSRAWVVAASVATVEAMKDQGICRWNHTIRSLHQHAKTQVRSISHQAKNLSSPTSAAMDSSQAAGEDQNAKKTEESLRKFMKMPFWQTTTNATTTSSSSSSSSTATSSSSMTSNGNGSVMGNSSVSHQLNQSHQQQLGERSSGYTTSNTMSFVTKSLLPTRRRLRLDPPNKLFFPYLFDKIDDEPGKQVRSAIGIKNTSKSHVAFKFQTTAPKSCYMRPPGAILAPGESLIATVFKFVEPPENNERPLDQKSRVKFKIMSLKVKDGMEYVPEMFDEQKDQVAVEQILRVIFLDPASPSPALDKLKRQLAEAEAELEARKRPPADTGPRVVGEGLVIDEWKERRERYLARQQIEVDSV